MAFLGQWLGRRVGDASLETGKGLFVFAHESIERTGIVGLDLVAVRRMSKGSLGRGFQDLLLHDTVFREGNIDEFVVTHFLIRIRLKGNCIHCLSGSVVWFLGKDFLWRLASR